MYLSGECQWQLRQRAFCLDRRSGQRHLRFDLLVQWPHAITSDATHVWVVNYVGKVIRAGFAATLSANQAGGRPHWRATKRLSIVEPPPTQNLRSGAANIAGGHPRKSPRSTVRIHQWRIGPAESVAIRSPRPGCNGRRLHARFSVTEGAATTSRGRRQPSAPELRDRRCRSDAPRLQGSAPRATRRDQRARSGPPGPATRGPEP